ncbi:acyltransferase ChoActase/COT/CPT [Limtongia smithiae]|uniref:acyltransferase ChoActase/COT/CPT n=1 Tax=Limtongia smithiae TaxID=1125753 RepID=UPI0034CFB12E
MPLPSLPTPATMPTTTTTTTSLVRPLRAFTSVPIRLNSTAAVKPAESSSGYVEDLSAGRMLRFQESLPHLPVPTLEQTATKYLKSVSHLLTPAQFAETTKIVQKFVSPSGEGPALQQKLLAKAADPKVKNWIYDWWNDAAYLTYRDPVVPYVSYFYGHKDDARYTTQASKGAVLATAALAFKKLIDTKQLEPEYLRKKAMCMDSYKYMFNASRVAATGRDYAVKYSPDEPNSKTITVICKDRFYILPHEVDGVQLSTAELEMQLQKIIYDANAKGHGPGIGAISSANRDDGVLYKDHLLSADATNKALFDQIEESSFVLAIDDKTVKSYNERSHQFWHGDGTNRFYDKPVQFIVCEGGISGFMGEHSMMDGTPTCRLNDFVCESILKDKLDHGAPLSAARSLPPPEELDFVVNDAVVADLAAAKQAFAEVIGLHELEVNAYKRFGKNLIKKFKTSPDAFVQLAFQVAYYRRNGVVRPTYESATTRQYQLGRTEVCRASTPESFAFVTALDDASVDKKTKIALARAALSAHVAYIGDATAGFGCDRHLFGLKKLVPPGTPMPEVFTDPTYSFSTTWIMSTSQLSSEYFNAYGWSQVTDEGYGIAYMINGDSLQFNVVSKKKDSKGMAAAIGKALDDLADMFASELPVSAKL